MSTISRISTRRDLSQPEQVMLLKVLAVLTEEEANDFFACSLEELHALLTSFAMGGEVVMRVAGFAAIAADRRVSLYALAGLISATLARIADATDAEDLDWSGTGAALRLLAEKSGCVTPLQHWCEVYSHEKEGLSVWGSVGVSYSIFSLLVMGNMVGGLVPDIYRALTVPEMSLPQMFDIAESDTGQALLGVATKIAVAL